MASTGNRPARDFGLGLLALAVFGAIAPWIGLYPVFVMKALCFAMFACAFNLLLGFTGLLSFGHAAFFAAAGYAAGYALKVWGWSTLAGLGFAVVCAGMLGLVVGALAIRRQGIYFAMVTLALAQMVFFVFLQSRFTGGEDGLQGIPRGDLLGLIDLSNDLNLYFVILGVFLATLAGCYRIVHSPYGQVLKAIRENEPRALSLGYRVDRYKLLAFVLSATLCGVAGACEAIVFQLASLTNVEFVISGDVLLMTLVGGVGTLLGPVVGSFVLVAMESYLAQFGSWVTIIQGSIFLICVMAFRAGIVGEVIKFLQRRDDRSKARMAEGALPSST